MLALLFVVVPAVEIYVIIKVGASLGAWPTLAIIGVTAVVGAALAKSQGIAVLNRMQASMASGEGTGMALIEGVLILVAGVTLLAPGFITDAIGLSLLLPPIRTVVAARFAARMQVVSLSAMSGRASGFHANAGRDEDQEPPPPGVIDV